MDSLTENKSVDYTPYKSEFLAIDTNMVYRILPAIRQGYNHYNRIGPNVTMTNIKLRALLYETATTPLPVFFALLYEYGNIPDLTTMTTRPLLSIERDGLTNTAGFPFVNPNLTDTYTVLYYKMGILSSAEPGLVIDTEIDNIALPSQYQPADTYDTLS